MTVNRRREAMKVETIASGVSDNFFYAVVDPRGRAGLIDPVDAEAAVARVREAGWELEWVINTHWHPDHVAGNAGVLAAFPEAQVVGPAGDRERIDAQFAGEARGAVEVEMRGGESLRIGELSLEVLDTPGHTEGHVSLRYGKHLFSGDVIFSGGAGHCRAGGDVSVQFSTFAHVLGALPDDTTFYAGHDYTARNCEFILSIEPEHREAGAVLEQAKASGPRERFESTLGQERAYNPFLRLADPGLRQALSSRYGESLEAARAQSQSEDEAVFRCLRALRDRW
ncbi:MBL fold metallo-hydrolase [Bradymonadaceae bacterium TMQ3]|nr:MBL fold metallo-hydrolase [Bradymonadaceae bacterium TMQ3]TXC76310.1 MBL fold metallo-hydrolase [Bradymonadales bacterium TMQ1]